MRILHRVALCATEAQRRELEALGVKLPSGVQLPGGGDRLVAFDVGEDHPKWTFLSTLFRRWQASDLVRTEFTQAEIRTAPWLAIAAWHHGYPQPDDDFGYLRATYDLSAWCERCGVGKKQTAPFQMTGKPRWGRKTIMQLVWVYDELFVRPEVWSRVFAPAGVACRRVLDTNGVELNTVTQLVVEATASLVTDGLPAASCDGCGRTKYLPVGRGAFPALRERPTTSMVRTTEYFGSGAQADQRILISANLSQALAAGGVVGAELQPVAASV